MADLLPVQSGASYSALTYSSSRTNMLAWRLPSVMLLLASTRFAGLDRQSLWFDEGYTLSLAKNTTIHGFLHTFGTFTTSEHLQPLYYFSIFLWSRIGGTADSAIRLPSAVFSIISGVIVYDFARRLPSRGVVQSVFPMLAASFYVCSSFAFYYAQEARPYALVQMLSFLVLTMWSRSRHSQPTGTMPFTAACLAASLASPFSALLVLTLSCTDLIFNRKQWLLRWRWPLLLISVGLVTYLTLGRFLLPSFIARDVITIRQPLWMNLSYVLYGMIFGTTLGPATSALRDAGKLHAVLAFWPLLTGCAFSVIALSRGLYLSAKSFGRGCLPRDLLWATMLYMFLLFFTFGVCGRLNVLPRHGSALYAIIFMLGVSSASCFSGYPKSDQPGRICLIAGLVGVLALNLLSMNSYWSDPSFRKDDYRATANLLHQGEPLLSGPTFLVAGDASLFQHYGVSLVDLSNVDPTALVHFLRSSSLDARDVTLVFNQHRNFRWDHSADPIEVLQPTYRCSSRRHLAYMEVMGCHLEAVDASLSAARQTDRVAGSHAR